MKFSKQNNIRGFIQMPIFIVIMIAAVLGGSAFVAYEVAKPSQNTSPKVAVETEMQATTTADSSATEQAEGKSDAPDGKDSVIDSLKKQVTDLTQKVSAPKIETQNTITAPKTTTVTLPSGAIVEMDANGNIIRTIKEAPLQTYVAGTPTTQNTESTTTNSSSQAQPVAPVSVPKYGIEYQKFSREYNGDEIFTLRYRLKSVSDNAPSIIKIVSRIYAVVSTGQQAVALDAWIRGNGFSDLNDTSYLTYLGSARIIVEEGGASVFRDVVIFEKTEYQVNIPAHNVSQELYFKFRIRSVASLSSMYLKSVSIDSTDGNIYKIEE